MSEAFVELLFWIVVFVVFFFGFKRLQNRKKERQANTQTSQVTKGRTQGSINPDPGDSGGGD